MRPEPSRSQGLRTRSRKQRARGDHIRALVRSDPAVIVRLWHAFRRLESLPFYTDLPKGVEFDEATFTQLCSTEDPLRLAGELREAGCPCELLPPSPPAGHATPEEAEQAKSALRLLAPFVTPSGMLALEVVANLNAECVESVLLLAGLRMKSPAQDGGFVATTLHGHRRTVKPDQYESLRQGLSVVQKAAIQVAKGQATVRMLADEAGRLRRLVRAAHEPSDTSTEDRVRLVEVHCGLPVPMAKGVITLNPKRRRELKGSWSRGWDEPEDTDFAGNWIVARAAKWLVGYCRGLEDAVIGQCPVCSGLWVEAREGRPAKFCPECRQRDLRSDVRSVQLKGGRRYIAWYAEQWILGYPAGRPNLDKGAKVRVLGDRVTPYGEPDTEVPVLHRGPLKRRPPPHAPRG